MINQISIKFYLHTLKAKGKKYPIYLRLTINRKKSEVFTSHSVEEKDWDEEKQRTKKFNRINAALSDIESEIYEIINQVKRDGKLLTSILIKNYLTKKIITDYKIIDYYEDCIERMKQAGELTEVTVAMYGYTKNHLANFLIDKKKVKDLHIKNIDYRFLSDFDSYLLNQKIKKSEKTLQRNTISKHHTRLRTIFIRAIKEGHLFKNPYTDFKLKSTPSNRTFLNTEELQKLMKHELGGNDSLRKVRDSFIFSVYTGLRFEDAQQLTMDKIVKENSGKYSLLIEQEKTKVPLAIPILEPAMNIIKKYENLPERKIFKSVLPRISNQKLNSYLKVIADLIGLDKKLTHHVARHTCATTVLLSNEVPIEVVSRWLGHTNIKTTQVYAKITNSYLHKIANNLEGKI